MIVIDTKRFEVKKNGRDARLTPKEFDLFLDLARLNGLVSSQQELTNYLWGINNLSVQTKTVIQHVTRIRKKLGRGAITTVFNRGYAVRVSTKII